jgi:Domain of unknown function (DUF6259)
MTQERCEGGAESQWDAGADSAAVPADSRTIYGINRRDFIARSAAGGAALLAAKVSPLVYAQNRAADQIEEPVPSVERVVLENELVRIELAPATGDIIGLKNKRTGRQYLGAREYAKAFRLNVPIPGRVTGFNADYSANSFDSWRQTGCTITRGLDHAGETLTVRHARLTSEAGAFPIEVVYTIRLADASDQALLQVQIANRSQHTVKEAFFPWISGVREVEGTDTDTFVAPNMIYRGTALRDHAHQEANWEEFPYLLGIPTWPDGYSLSMPWMNYGGRGEGLYLASHARTGVHHMLMVQDYGSAGHPILAFAWAFPCYVHPGKTWHSPELVLSLHEGDWHAAADKYRASLDGWYRRPQTQAKFRRSFASFNSFFTKRDFMQLTELAEDIRKYDVQNLVMWNFGDYYPEVLKPDDLSVDPPRLGQFAAQWGGLARLQAANRKARELGVSTGIIFSQRLWNKDTLTPELHRMAEEWAIRRESGDPIWESWDHQHLGAAQWSNQGQSFGHLDYVMCSGVEDYRRFAMHNVRGVLKEAGYSMMFYDQVVEGNVCFSAGHHHDDVSAPSLATLNFVRDLKEGMTEDDPDSVLIGEGWEVLSSQHLDSGWVWRVPPNPEVLRYTLPWVVNTSAVEVDPSMANRYLILGLQLAIVAGGLENGKNLSDFPDFAGHIKRVAAFRKQTEQFWIDGSFQDDLGLQASGGFAKVYEAGGDVAIMAAELEGKESTFRFGLDTSRYAISDNAYSVISSERASSAGIANAEGGAIRGNLQLKPYELAAVIFHAGNKP